MYKATELDKMPEADFQDFVRRVALEQARRSKPKFGPEDYQGLDNFLCGVAHAMSCRFALRWLRGHTPFGSGVGTSGGTPASGEMWHALDGSNLSRRVAAGLGPSVRTKVDPRQGLNKNYSTIGPERTLNTNPLEWTTKGDLVRHLVTNTRYSYAKDSHPLLGPSSRVQY